MKKNLQQGFTLIELLVVIGIIAVLAAIVLIAINPARQFAQARNAERNSEVNAILNAIGQYVAETKGGTIATDGDTATDQVIGSGNGQANICATLSPTYISALPIDPGTTNGAAPNKDQVNDCTQAYNTNYTINVDASGRYVIKAPAAELGQTISLTR